MSKDPETYAIVESSSVHSYESLHVNGVDNIKHCHDNSRAKEDRELEKKTARKRLYVVTVICVIFMTVEIIGGYYAGSLAVMTDAAHLMVDLISFIISLISLWLSSKPTTHRLSFGWHRAEILGALLSIFTIWLITGVLVYLAVKRLISDNYTIDGTIMLITSIFAVLANVIMAVTLFYSGHGHSHGGLSSHSHGHGHSHGNSQSNTQSNTDRENNEISNHANNNHTNDEHADPEQNEATQGRRTQQANASVRSAFVHVVGDLLQSISVFISAIIIYFRPEYKIADPICTFLFSIFVLCTTLTILKDIVLVLMEGTPLGVKYSEVQESLLAVKGVKAVHELHIWALTMNQALLTAHVAIDDSVDPQTVLREMTQSCFSSYNFHSVTFQMERQADLKPECILCLPPKV